MTQNEILTAILQVSLTEAKETIGVLKTTKGCAELVVKMYQTIQLILSDLETYEKHQKDKA